jgi:Proton-conducting membrane transporter/NADH-ubiquinone oxidoreductase chain 4, amino terminus
MGSLFQGGHLLSILIFFPAVGALALMLLRGDDHIFIRRIALIVSVAEFLFSLLLLRGIPLNMSGYRLEENAQWITTPPIHYHLGVDGISLFLVILTTFLTPISVLASWSSIGHRVKEFFVMLLMLEVGVVGVFLSLDLFLFFLFWEVMLIPMAMLIGIWGHERRIYAAVKFVLYTMAGSILMLVGIIWLYNATGTFDLPTIQQMTQTGTLVLEPRAEMLLFLAFFVAFAVKVPLAAGRARGSAYGGFGNVSGRAAENGHLRHDAFLLAVVSGSGAPRGSLGCDAGDHRNYLRRAGGAGTAQLEKARGVLVGKPLGFRGAGNFCVPQYFHAGRGVPDAGARDFDRRAVFAGGHAVRPAAYV